jgi:hypothetical protein
MRAEIIFNMLAKIASSPFKLNTTISAFLFNSVFWILTLSWTLVIASTRTIFSIVTYKTFELFTANWTRLSFLSGKVGSTLFHNYKYSSITELDKDYFEAQEKRFQNHIAQLKLFQP